MDLHEECGVFGIISQTTADVAEITYYGLYALQHRGQESCGIVVNNNGMFSSHKDLGLVSEVLTSEVLSHLPKGNMAVGHVRYGTTGGSSRSNCQPIEVNRSDVTAKIDLCKRSLWIPPTLLWENVRWNVCSCF